LTLRALYLAAKDKVGTLDRRALAVLIACGIALLAWGSAPDLKPFAARVVDAGAVELYPGNEVGLPVPVASGRLQIADPARADEIKRQLHFDVPEADGIAFYMPASPVESALWVNGMVGGDSVAGRYFGPGFGRHRLSLEIPASRLSFDENRIDIVTQSGWTPAQVPLIYAIPAQNGPAFAVMAETAERHLRLGTIGFGALGLGAALFGLLFLRSRMLFLGGALYSFGLFDMGFGLLPSAMRLSMMALGLLILAYWGWRRPALSGAMLASGVSLLLGLWVLSGWGASLPMLWGMNFALWPLAGIALPMIAASEGQGLWSDFVAARAKIREQESVIVQQREELEESIRAQAVGEERQRFVRDMHDGVGGHLLSLLMRVRAEDADKDDVAAELEKGLTDLRLMADSLDNVGTDLDAALAAFHRRAAQQLSSAGLAFDWVKPDQLSDFHMDARAVLNLYRIIQEALSNCIRHAQAGRFAVAFALADNGQRLDVTIDDDGVGFAPGAAEGRGLANIRKRAEKLGSLVTFGPGEGGKGTRICLSVSAS
jgi:signal transduction histidine kinase